MSKNKEAIDRKQMFLIGLALFAGGLLGTYFIFYLGAFTHIFGTETEARVISSAYCDKGYRYSSPSSSGLCADRVSYTIKGKQYEAPISSMNPYPEDAPAITIQAKVNPFNKGVVVEKRQAHDLFLETIFSIGAILFTLIGSFLLAASISKDKQPSSR